VAPIPLALDPRIKAGVLLYPGGHEIFATLRSQIVQEVVRWLNRYVGRVQ
jgi:hypothetical protein